MAGTLGEILLAAGKITPEQLARAVARQQEAGGMLGDTLVELGFVRDEDVARALASQLNIPFLPLGEDFRMEKEEVKLVPETIARRFCVIPVRKAAGPTLTLVMKDPLDANAVDAVRALTRLEIHKAVSTAERIMAAINRFYAEDAHIEQHLKDIVELEAEAAEDNGFGGRFDAEQLRLQANDAPVVRFVNLLLMQAVRDRASDIHFEPGEKSVTVRLRVDGLLREVTPPPRALYPAIVTRIKILANMDIAERRLPLDGRFKFRSHQRVIDVRVSSLPVAHGEKLVLRILDREALLTDMRDIGFDDALLKRFQRILHLPHGIILLTGPTGSGKTTTLYSALLYLRHPSLNIQTVEDPIEYLLPGINQMQIKPRINLDFANALRAILRQDPDIIMIGEIRDLETAQIATRAALTGHLVLSTLHTNDAPSAVWRLRDIGIEAYLLAATLKLVLSQRLVRVLCPACTTETMPSQETLELATAAVPGAVSWKFMRGAGCARCSRTGFYGRTGIFEFLEISDPLRDLILSGAGAVDFRRRAIELGMEPLLVNGLRKVQQGITTVEEVVSVCAGDELA